MEGDKCLSSTVREQSELNGLASHRIAASSPKRLVVPYTCAFRASRSAPTGPPGQRGQSGVVYKAAGCSTGHTSSDVLYGRSEVLWKGLRTYNRTTSLAETVRSFLPCIQERLSDGPSRGSEHREDEALYVSYRQRATGPGVRPEGVWTG